jgi:tetratricopeptide (TPR) repeat protein
MMTGNLSVLVLLPILVFNTFSCVFGLDCKDEYDCLNQANDYNKKGDLVTAIAYYDRAIDIDNNYAEAFLARGIAYFKDSNITEAMRNFNRAIQINPRYVDAYLSRGIALAATADFDGALTEYNNAIRFDPDNAAAYYHRAEAYYGKYMYDNSRQSLDKAIQLGYKPDPQFVKDLVKMQRSTGDVIGLQ